MWSLWFMRIWRRIRVKWQRMKGRSKRRKRTHKQESMSRRSNIIHSKERRRIRSVLNSRMALIKMIISNSPYNPTRKLNDTSFS